MEEPGRSLIDPRPGLIAALIVGASYAGVALSVVFPRVAFGFQSDEATYYMMTYSLARDGDLTYRREDLARVWREFPSGPSGLFLKKGRVLDITVDSRPPFLHAVSRPDPDSERLYYGKSFVYPLFAAPFVAALDTNGFLLLHAVLLALMTAAAYLFINARARPLVSVLLATGFLMASVAPAYASWLTPELFNLACVLLGYFCWLYKEVTTVDRAPRGAAWLFGARGELAAAVLLGLATASKPSNALLVGPMLLWLAWHRLWRRGVAAGVVFALVVVGFFAANMAISGEWNFQGGERATFYAAYPFQNAEYTFDVGISRATDTVLTDVIFSSDFWTVFFHNLFWFFFGRYSGLVAYFFPAVFALLAFALARRRRAAWQYLVLAAALAEILLVIIWIPYNYFGGGGVLGNRYFMNTYGLFLFLLPPIESLASAATLWIVGAIFTAQITLNPFFASFHPAEHAKHGPLRWLPPELSLINDLPVNADHKRARILFGERARFQIYFLDDNAYEREGLSFWVRGESTAEFLIKTATLPKQLMLTLANGAVENQVTVRAAGGRRSLEFAVGEVKEITLPLDEGFPYQGRWVYRASIASRAGFVPLFTEGTTDHRFLGVLVKPELIY